MDFQFRKIGGQYLEMTTTDGNTVINSGLMDSSEASKLLGEFKGAIEYIEWYLNSVTND